MEQIITIDIGNTRAKYAIFEGNSIVENGVFSIDNRELETIIDAHPRLKRGILSTVNGHIDDVKDQAKAIDLKVLTCDLKLPFSIGINNPNEVGADLLAAAAAAFDRFKGNNVLVIDAGSCITYQIMNKEGVFVGGAISPGVQLRLKAMCEHTALLPLVEANYNPSLVGTDTITCIQSGVMNGIRAELSGLIDRYSEIYEDLIIFIGGGDNNFLDKKLENRIFADPNLVMNGLRIILEYNS